MSWAGEASPRDGKVVRRPPSRVMEFQDRAPPSALSGKALKLQQKPESLPHGPQHLDRNHSQRTTHQALY